MSSQHVGSSRVLQTLLDKLDIFEEMEDVKREQYIERQIDKLDKFTVYINSDSYRHKSNQGIDAYTCKM